MPVEDDIDLDNPDGLTQEDIDALKRQAEEIELYAENIEENVKKVEEGSKKIKDATGGMDLYQKDLLRSGSSNVDVQAGVGSFNDEQLSEKVAKILVKMKKSEEERKLNRSDIDEAKIHRAQLERQISQGLAKVEGGFNELLAAGSNPIGFVTGKIKGMITKLGLAGVIIGVVHRVAETLWKEYIKTFSPGGVNDVRKMMEDRDKEMLELDDILARRSGRVFFTGDVDLRQGAPQFSNTERLRDQVLRYQALHLGE